MAKQRHKILVTGARRPVARRLIRMLHRHSKVVAVDRRCPQHLPVDVRCEAVDLRRRALDHLFRRHRFDAIIHAGTLTNLRADESLHHAYNVVAVNRLLKLAVQKGVAKVIILSSAELYGHRPANTVFLSEDAPLLAGERFAAWRDLVQMDLAGCVTAWREPATEVVIARPVNVVGSGIDSMAMRYLGRPRVPVVLGFDPQVQLIHIEDFCSAIQALLAPGIRGAVNIAGPAPVRISQALQFLGRKRIPIPRTALTLALKSAWSMRASGFREEELDLIQYSCVVSDNHLREATGFQPAYSLRDTLRGVDEPF